MDFEYIVYSVGDFALLAKILNGIAFFEYEGYFVQLGFLVGLFLVMIRTIATQKIELQWFLIGYVIYSVMFVPRVMVTVVDTYTDRSESVDNVPLGPAIAGSLFSRIGYELTKLFEQAFGDIGAITAGGGYLNSLNTLFAFRNVDAGTANNFGGDNTDMEKTLQNYLVSCVFYDIEMNILPNNITWEKLKNSADLLTDIKVEATVWDTVTYLSGDPNGDVTTCSEAYTQIYAAMNNGDFYTKWNAYLTAQLGGTDNAETSVQAALTGLEIEGTTAQQYMLNAYLSNMLRDSDLIYAAENGGEAAVVIRTQAMEQRRVQWAAEQSLFLETARPIMAFIEAIAFGISPIMPFLLGLGQMGLSLIGKYMIILLWIQLWAPIMAICNLYLNMAARGTLGALQDSGMDIASMRGLDHYYTEAATWIATGGMLAAATPMLSLFLITGSTYAFTSLAGRLSGGDHINEKTTAPDILNSEPLVQKGGLLSVQPTFTQNAVTGITTTGSDATRFTLSASSVSSAANSIATSEMQGARESFERTRSEIIAKSQAVQGTASYMESVRESGINTESNAYQFTQAIAKNSNQIQSLTGTQQALAEKALHLGMNLSLGANAGVSSDKALLGKAVAKLAGLSGGVRGSVEANRTTGDRYTDSDLKAVTNAVATTIDNAYRADKNTGNTYLDQMQRDFTTTQGNSLTMGLDERDQEALNRATSEYTEKSQRLEQTQSHNANTNLDESHDLAAIAQMMSKENKDSLVSYVLNKSGGAIKATFEQMVSSPAFKTKFPNSANREAAAAIWAINTNYGQAEQEKGPHERNEYLDSMNKMLLSVKSTGVFSGVTVPSTTPESFSGGNGTRQSVSARVPDPMPKSPLQPQLDAIEDRMAAHGNQIHEAGYTMQQQRGKSANAWQQTTPDLATFSAQADQHLMGSEARFPDKTTLANDVKRAINTGIGEKEKADDLIERFGDGLLTVTPDKLIERLQARSDLHNPDNDDPKKKLNSAEEKSIPTATSPTDEKQKFSNVSVTKAFKTHQEEANETSAEISERGYFKGKGEADWIYQNNSDPNLQLNIDASRLTVSITGKWEPDPRGGIMASGNVEGDEYWIHGQVTVRYRPDGTYRIYDQPYDYEMHIPTSPKDIVRDIATFVGSPPGGWPNTPFWIHYKGSPNITNPYKP